jgi:hypothetical protein
LSQQKPDLLPLAADFMAQASASSSQFMWSDAQHLIDRAGLA